MSIEIMSLVFKHYPVGGNPMNLALALADHADDAGGRIFPSVAALAKKTRQSERNVQYQLRKMEADGFLVLVNAARGGSGRCYGTREYRINLDFFSRGAKIAPLDTEKEAWGCKPPCLGVQTAVSGGATAIAPESSRTIIEPSKPSVATKQLPEDKIQFDPDTKSFYSLPDAQVLEWQKAFPKLDIDLELSKAELWLDANPKKRKKDYKKFLYGWLSRANENAQPRVFVPRIPNQPGAG